MITSETTDYLSTKNSMLPLASFMTFVWRIKTMKCTLITKTTLLIIRIISYMLLFIQKIVWNICSKYVGAFSESNDRQTYSNRKRVTALDFITFPVVNTLFHKTIYLCLIQLTKSGHLYGLICPLSDNLIHYRYQKRMMAVVFAKPKEPWHF